MKEEKKSVDKGLIIAIVCITVIASLVCGATFMLNNKKNNNTVNINEVTNTAEDLEPNQEQDDNNDNGELTAFETKSNISKYVKKLEDIYGFTETTLSKDDLELLKGISFESLEYETSSNSYDNPNITLAYYAFFIDKKGQQTECEDGYACRKYSKDSFEKIAGYFGLNLDSSLDSNYFTKDNDDNYIVKLPFTGLEGPAVEKVFKTYKNGNYVYLLVTYKKNNSDDEFYANSMMLHTFKINNKSYTIIRSQAINLYALQDNIVNISLGKRNEEYHIGKYYLLFTGTQDGEIYNKPVYKYLLSLKYSDRNLKGTGINTSGNLYSDNGAAQFSLIKIDNVYILIAEVASVGYYQSVVILDNAGNILKDYAHVSSLSIKDHTVSISYTTDTSDSCSYHGGPETGCVESNDVFTVSGNKLIK